MLIISLYAAWLTFSLRFAMCNSSYYVFVLLNVLLKCCFKLLLCYPVSFIFYLIW